MKRSRVTAAVAVCALAALTLGACSSGDSGKAGSSGKSSASASGPITFWGWAPGYPEVVKLWNSEHPDSQVKFQQIASGTQGGYDKMLTAVKAGNAPCLGQVGFETFTSFLAAGALEDVTKYTADAKSQFPAWVWNQVTLDGKTYGIPVDVGPMAMFYRADKFKAAGIKVPTTWAEFKQAAQQIKAYDPKSRIMNFGNDAYNYSGFPWQSGAQWFGIQGDSWKVSIDSPENQKVASYWQDLASSDLVAKLPSWDAALYKAWNDGTVWTEVGAVWTTGLLKSEAKGASGKWAVAPMPTNPGSDAVGNVGGSPTAVLKGCKDPGTAVKFATWMATDPGAVKILIDKGGLYPASIPGTENAALKQGDPYFGGQKIYDVFSNEMKKVNTDWQWGPVMTVTAQAIADGLGKVQSGQETMNQVLSDAQQKTTAEIKSQGYSLAK